MVVVKTNDRRIFKAGEPHYARFVFSEVFVHPTVTSWHDTLRVIGVCEVTEKSWLRNPDRIGSSWRIGSVAAEVLFDSSCILDSELPTMHDALRFACEELNPMLESMTTLAGIADNIDITVEHRLRPTPRLLRNLVQPLPNSSIFRRKP